MKNIKMIKLEKNECKDLNGGTFAWDVGWFIGNTIAGNWLSLGGTAEAFADYVIHYHVEQE